MNYILKFYIFYKIYKKKGKKTKINYLEEIYNLIMFILKIGKVCIYGIFSK